MRRTLSSTFLALAFTAATTLAADAPPAKKPEDKPAAAAKPKAAEPKPRAPTRVAPDDEPAKKTDAPKPDSKKLGATKPEKPLTPGGVYRAGDIERPRPAVIAPGAAYGAPPADAIVLFDGKDLSKWNGEPRRVPTTPAPKQPTAKQPVAKESPAKKDRPIKNPLVTQPPAKQPSAKQPSANASSIEPPKLTTVITDRPTGVIAEVGSANSAAAKFAKTDTPAKERTKVAGDKLSTVEKPKIEKKPEPLKTVPVVTPAKPERPADPPAAWKIAAESDGGYMEVPQPRIGGIVTKDEFGSCQIHIEWATPSEVKGAGQGRGNSGIMLHGIGEVQVLDSYENDTYPDGQAAAIYSKYPPLVNASRKPGEWQTYDIVVELAELEPKTNQVKRPARITVMHNGVIAQHASEVDSRATKFKLALQDHGNPVRYRNIWVRPLKQIATSKP